MASKNFSGILRDPLGELAYKDKFRFTHVSTTGEVIRGSISSIDIPENGAYDIDIEYGNVLIESLDRKSSRWLNHGTVTINQDTSVTTLPSLLLATVPATPELVIQLEALLADAETAANDAQASADSAANSADVALASVDTSSAIYDEVNDIVTGEGVLSGATSAHKAMRRCTLLDDGTVNYYLDANNSNLRFDGTASDLTGADGQVMVEIPKCYVKAVYLQGGASPIIEWSVSANPRQGYVLHPAFIKDGNLVYNTQLGMWNYENYTKVVDYIYVGAYIASVFDTSGSEYIDGLNLDDNSSRVDTSTDKLASVSGKYPMVGLTRAQFRNVAENRGAGWQQLDFWTQSLLQLLYTTECRNLNSQASVGDGAVSVSGGYPASSAVQTDSPHTIAGKSNAVGNATGAVNSAVRDVSWVSYRGVEHFWGNCYQWGDGVNILDRVAFVNNTGVFADNTTSSGYAQLGIACPDTNGYIRGVQSDTLSYLASDSAGSSSIGFCDYYYQDSGHRAAAFGGSASLGAGAGAFIWLGNASSGYRNRNRGGRLVYKAVV